MKLVFLLFNRKQIFLNVLFSLLTFYSSFVIKLKLFLKYFCPMIFFKKEKQEIKSNSTYKAHI